MYWDPIISEVKLTLQLMRAIGPFAYLVTCAPIKKTWGPDDCPNLSIYLHYMYMS